jgi:hypothetical protein
LLDLTQDATCESIAAANPQPTQSPTLLSVIGGRRGPLGSLLASRANLETPLPLIDIVNENLESLAVTVNATPKVMSGVVYDTAGDKLGDHVLCADGPGSSNGEIEERQDCHDRAALFATLPQILDAGGTGATARGV